MKQSNNAITWLNMPEEKELPEDMQTLFGKAKHALGEVPNVFRVFGLAPKHFMKWFKYYDYLMRNDNSDYDGVSPAEREMIAVVVSAENRCEYCLGSHTSYLRGHIKDPVKAELLSHNYRRADLSTRERTMLDFAVKMTNESEKMSPDDLAILREEGFSDEAIFDIAQVVAMFNSTNRMANALGWKPNHSYYGDHRDYSEQEDS